MENFLTEYKDHIIFVIVVISSFFILRFSTNLFHSYYLKRIDSKYSKEKTRVSRLIKRILNSLWIILALISLSFLFVEEDSYGVLLNNYKLILYLGLVIVLTIILAVIVNLWFKNNIQKKIHEKQDPTSFKFLRYLAVIGIYSVGALFCLLAFPSLRGVAQTALGGAGVIAIIGGIASQEALSNLVGGLFIISFKPFRIGDIIKISDTMMGTVQDITLRHTVIRDFENKMIVIPNAIINQEKLVNYNLGETMCCKHIEVDISYQSNIDLAKHILKEECESHRNIIDMRSELDKMNNVPKVVVRVLGLEESSVRLRAWAWTKDFTDSFVLKCEVLESVKKRFDKEGIEIPFPYRNVVIKNPANSSTDS